MKTILGIAALMSAITPATGFAQTIDPATTPNQLEGSANGSDREPHRYVRDETKICFERPTKSNAPCVMPAGTLQLETDVGNWTVSSDAGVRTDTVQYLNPTLKYGIGGYTDVEANVAPYVDVRTRDGSGVSHQRGVGDLSLRLKHRFSNPNATVRYAIIGIVKAPTAKIGIGNGQWEGGVSFPVVVKLKDDWALTFSPEADVLADQAHPGRRHAQLVTTAVIQKPITERLMAFAELWTAQNYDPDGHVHQYSADVAVAYMITPKIQVDVGGNFGLNRETPNAQIIAGLGTRF